MEHKAPTTRADHADVLTVGFATTASIAAAFFFCCWPPRSAPYWLVMSLMLALMLAGGFLAGRWTRRGWRGGLYAGALSAALNLILLGSLMGGRQSNPVELGGLAIVAALLAAGIVLAVLGGRVGASFAPPQAPPVNWTGALTLVVTAATFVLVVIGGLVTSEEAGLAVVDWPNTFGHNMFLYPFSQMTGGVYYEHAHRLFASLVGLATLALAVHLWRVERRGWVRKLALLCVAMVVLQGVLGGLRVTGRFTLSASPADVKPNIDLAAFHGVLAQAFFATVAALAVFVSAAWSNPRRSPYRPSLATDRVLNAGLIALLAAQLTLGSILRHLVKALLLHVALGCCVVAVAVLASLRAWGFYGDQPAIRRVGKTLLLLAAVQFLLGIGALTVTGIPTPEIPPTPIEALLATAHQAAGALLLACAVVQAAWLFRPTAPAPASRPPE